MGTLRHRTGAVSMTKCIEGSRRGLPSYGLAELEPRLVVVNRTEAAQGQGPEREP